MTGPHPLYDHWRNLGAATKKDYRSIVSVRKGSSLNRGISNEGSRG